MRFFGKPLPPTNTNRTARTLGLPDLLPKFDISVTRLCASRRNADHNNLVATRRDGNPRSQDIGKPYPILDNMIRRKNPDYSLRLGLLQKKRRKCARWSRVPCRGFAQNMSKRHLTKLLCNKLIQQIIRDDPHITWIANRNKPVHCLLDHRPVAI